MTFSTTIQETPQGIRLVLHGEIDLCTRDAFRRALRAAIGEPPHAIEVDFLDVSFLACAGVGVLAERLHAAHRGGYAVAVTGQHGIVARILDLTGILAPYASDVALATTF